MRKHTRQIRGLVATIVATAVVAVGCQSADEPDDRANPTAAADDNVAETEPAGDSEDSGDDADGNDVTLPETPIGEQMTWFLDALPDAPIEEEELAEHFNEPFLDQVSAEELNTILAQLTGMRAEEIVHESPTEMVLLVAIDGERMHLSVGVDDDGLFETWFVQPAELPEAPASWSELDDRVEQLAPETGFLAAEVTPAGECRPVHEIDADDARPLGSIFKVYVLHTITEQIAAGELDWSDELVIDADAKSWPTGELQDREDGATATVREAADLMISISDNTATDLLIDAAGRENVEATIAATSAHAEANVPLLKTRELFQLKTLDYPERIGAYLALDSADRRAYLDDELAGTDLPDIEDVQWDEPLLIEEVEWFGSPIDLCHAYAALQQLGSDEAAAVMSIHDGGLELDGTGTDWQPVWFKGGSEPGVLAMAHLAQTTDGDTYFVATMAADPDTAIDQLGDSMEMLSLTTGALTILSD